MRDLNDLLQGLDPQAPLAERHLWLIHTLGWVRGDGVSPQGAIQRLKLLIDAVDARPELAGRLQAWWAALYLGVDVTALLADYGFAPRHSFTSELADRIRHRLLPGTPETTDAAELFDMAVNGQADTPWLAALDSETVDRIARLLALPPQAPGQTPWQTDLLDAVIYCCSQIRGTGFAPEVRLRMDPHTVSARPFHQLAADAEAFRVSFEQAMAVAGRDGHAGSDGAVLAAAQRLRERLDTCRHAAASVYGHLDAHGISVGLVFRLRQLRERVVRVRELMDCLLDARPAPPAARLMARLAARSAERRSVRALIRANSSLLAAKVAERSAETGEHYITRDRAEYKDMLRKAAGGGAFMSITTLVKFGVMALGLSAFWTGFAAGLNYALSFVAIQLLHWTVATKQPAMTAPAMAAKLKDMSHPGAVDGFVDEVTHLVRSQVAAVVGNLAVVAPAVLLLCGLWHLASGQPAIDRAHAEHVLHDLTLLGPTLLFAAFTGVLLFASSIVAGWAENWFVLHRLDSALRYHPRITDALGTERAARWAAFWRDNISGFAANVSLGLMLGLVPAFAAFFGLALEVRHVTLGTGQVAAAAATLGREALSTPALWWCLAALPLTGALNVCVSFYLAFRLALAAQAISGVDRQRLNAAIWARWRTRARDFFVPR